MTIKRRISLKVQESSHILINEAKTHPQKFRVIKKAETRLKLSTISSSSHEHQFDLTRTPNAVGNDIGSNNQNSTKVSDEDFPHVLQLNENHIPFQSDTHFLNNIERSSDSSINSDNNIHGALALAGSKIPKSILMPDLDHN